MQLECALLVITTLVESYAVVNHVMPILTVLQAPVLELPALDALPPLALFVTMLLALMTQTAPQAPATTACACLATTALLDNSVTTQLALKTLLVLLRTALMANALCAELPPISVLDLTANLEVPALLKPVQVEFVQVATTLFRDPIAQELLVLRTQTARLELA